MTNDTVYLHRTPNFIGFAQEQAVTDADALTCRFFDCAGKEWSPQSVEAVAPAGKSPFGQKMVWVQYEFAEPKTYAFPELRSATRSLIESGPEALWTRLVPYDQLLSAVAETSTFEELAEVISNQAGMGDPAP